MTELQNKPTVQDFGGKPFGEEGSVEWGNGASGFDNMMKFHYAETAYYKARCAVAERALTYIGQGGNTVSAGVDYATHLERHAKLILSQIVASETP